ncbi:MULTISPECIES: hypothetical protein [Moorena]|nr:hypothetical protein [Moorena producens]OLT66043.1 hypothetical protein BI334_14360 [Moorena producens 3L]
MTATLTTSQSIESWLGDEAESLLSYKAKLRKELLHLPGPDWVARIFGNSDRYCQVLRSLQQFYSTGLLLIVGSLIV